MGSREGNDPAVATRRREADASILKGSERGAGGKKEGVIGRRVRREGERGEGLGEDGRGGGGGGGIGWGRKVFGGMGGKFLKGGF